MADDVFFVRITQYKILLDRIRRIDAESPVLQERLAPKRSKLEGEEEFIRQHLSSQYPDEWEAYQKRKRITPPLIV